MNTFKEKVFYYLIHFLQVQLFLTLASFPILVAWGLPLSIMTAVGNLIFSPFLTAFLLCASLVFFTECLYIPNGWLIYLLEKITNFWIWCLSWGQKSWLIGFAKPSLFILIGIVICAFLIMQHKKLGRLLPSLCALSLLLFFSSIYLCSFKPCNTEYDIECGKRKVTIKIKNGITELHDNGALAAKLSPDSWIQYTFLSELTKKSGITQIDHVFISNPGTLTFQALTTLCKHITVKTVSLPFFTRQISSYGWKKFFECKRTLHKENVTLIRSPQTLYKDLSP
ncbi:hypothetical protein K9K77_01710 [Candidatus Babeliales bacterium]|nr:hypothetical protein [Candidatus Babeliales bacterium]